MKAQSHSPEKSKRSSAKQHLARHVALHTASTAWSDSSERKCYAVVIDNHTWVPACIEQQSDHNNQLSANRPRLREQLSHHQALMGFSHSDHAALFHEHLMSQRKGAHAQQLELAKLARAQSAMIASCKRSSTPIPLPCHEAPLSLASDPHGNENGHPARVTAKTPAARMSPLALRLCWPATKWLVGAEPIMAEKRPAKWVAAPTGRHQMAEKWLGIWPDKQKSPNSSSPDICLAIFRPFGLPCRAPPAFSWAISRNFLWFPFPICSRPVKSQHLRCCFDWYHVVVDREQPDEMTRLLGWELTGFHTVSNSTNRNNAQKPTLQSDWEIS